MPSDHGDEERRDAAPLAWGVERYTALQPVSAAAEGVGNRQRMRALDNRPVPPQFYQEVERALEISLAQEAVEGGVELIKLIQGPAVEPGPVF